jgi:transposase-like protein
METTIISIKGLISEEQCYKTTRELRWPDGVYCRHCDSDRIIKRGSHTNQPERNRYECKACGKRFDDLTGTVLAGHHQPLSTWILCLYFMGLNLSNGQIAQELDLNKDDLQYMTEHLRNGIDKKKIR